jgi:hypothetical protein
MKRFQLTWVWLALFACPEPAARQSPPSTAAQRTRAFCALTMCPTTPEDVLFQVVGSELRAVLRLPAPDVAAWARHCTPASLEVRPSWFGSLTKGSGWVPTTAPDRVRCGSQSRVIHVKDRLVVLTAVLPD